jgi:hypothetical protein
MRRALAAILGMIPLAGSLFWGPMAITIMGGLFVATVLTLLVVPALYALWFRARQDETTPAAASDPADDFDPGSPRNERRAAVPRERRRRLPPIRIIDARLAINSSACIAEMRGAA